MMSNRTKCLVLVAVVLGPAGTGARQAAETPGDTQKLRSGEPKNPTTKRTPNAETFYKSGTVQEIHLRVTDDDLARMQAALPKRIYV
ncbi:MAG: hypothetical protein CMJ69_08215, partial [Planctomycetaceae bacterium]|nr:hypothetical protein [Planctomycetaceae bacterium]